MKKMTLTLACVSILSYTAMIGTAFGAENITHEIDMTAPQMGGNTATQIGNESGAASTSSTPTNIGDKTPPNSKDQQKMETKMQKEMQKDLGGSSSKPRKKDKRKSNR
jgi:hypothetical protein